MVCSMLNKRAQLLLCSLVFILGFTACSKREENGVSTESQTFSASTEAAIMATTSDASSIIPNAIFGVDQSIPIISNKKLIGTMTINWIDKIGIWDWYNEQAVEAGIKYCYSVNATIDMSEYLKESSDITMRFDPVLYNKNSEMIGKTCNIGWSGFDQFAQFFRGDSIKTIEVCLQPVIADTEEYGFFCLQLSDPQKKLEIDPIYVDISILQNATETIKIHTVQEPITLTSINGAVIELSLGDVYYENHGVDSSDNKFYYDFSYEVKYLSGPTNSREVLSFDSFHENQLVASPQIILYADNCNYGLDTEDNTATRFIDYEETEQEEYVQQLANKIDVGYKSTAITNRLAMQPNLKTKYVRFIIQFPEEAAACTKEELHRFAGRYLVFQVPISQRKLVHIE